MNRKQLPLLLAAAVLVSCGGGSEAPAPASKPAAPTAAAGYQGGPVSNGGMVAGTVSYAGTKTDASVTVTKDQDTCAVHGQTMAEHSLVVTDGKLQNAVVWIEDIDEGKPWSKSVVTVDNIGCMFEPRVSVGYKGAEINAKNSDPVLHNTHLWLGTKTIANIALPSQGQEIKKKLKKGGIHKVTCDAHEWMLAWVFVAENPYAAVTGPDGRFELADVPAGQYELKFWHERLGEQTKSVTVSAGGTTAADVTFN